MLIAGSACAGLAQELSGHVFIDQNNNGQFDAGESGVPSVAVSDQVLVVLTDASGRFELTPTSGKTVVMISVPNQFRATHGFWKTIGTGAPLDFALAKSPMPQEWSFVHASDTHLSEQSVVRTEKLRQLVDPLKPAFMIVSGDLTRDALRVPEAEARRYYQLYVDEMKKFSVPVWSVPGNHEIFGIERHLSLVSPSHPLYGKKMYAQYLGPNYYSFNYGGIHFVGLDDVDFADTWYYGHVDSAQVAWLKKDLASVPASTPVVTFQHMPLFSGGLSLGPYEEAGPGRTLERVNGVLQYRHVVSNAQELLKILQTHPHPLSLAGHFHARQIFRYESTGQNTRFEQTAAIVGNGGEGDIEMKSGFVVYKVKSGSIDGGTFVPLD